MNLLFTNLSLIISFILFAASLIIAYAFGYQPRVRKETLEKLEKTIMIKNKELLALYKDIQALIQIEASLCEESDISKQKAREGFSISYRCEPQRIAKKD